ncbi:MAG: NUDIX domain-containing protein [Alphaproteobacteria bacterium]|nr:NUDIX domain-containing protein [Alphaproteobacteria bacterium]
MTNPKSWKQLKSETVYENPYYTLMRDDVELPGGKLLQGYHYRINHSWVAIFVLSPDGKVLLERQNRYPNNILTWELPAGRLEKGEEPLQAALRELKEETGVVATKAEKIGEYVIDPVASTGRVTLFFVNDFIETNERNLDYGEDIEAAWVDLAAMKAMMARGEIAPIAHLGLIHEILSKKAL